MKTEDICYGHSGTYGTMRYLTTILCLLFLLSACATTSPQQVQWKHDAEQPLTCTKGPDCEAKWGRALIWVQNNAKAPIEIANETIITTDFPFDYDHSVISVTKTETDTGVYEIHFRAACKAIFACTPTILELKASFANYVMKSIEASPADGSQTPKTQKDKAPVRQIADLGAVTVKTSKTAANKLGMKEPKGVRIIYIGSDSAAFDSGLQLDDVILKFADKLIDDVEDLDSALEQTTPPRIVSVTIWRAGAGEMVIPVRFGKMHIKYL